jgi:hypothetical protein
MCKMCSECSTWLLFQVAASNIGYCNILGVAAVGVSGVVISVVFGSAIVAWLSCSVRC